MNAVPPVGPIVPGRYSSLAILLSNLAAIAVAVVQNWDLRPLLIVYWAQSVIIGFFNFIRIIKLKDFSTEGLTSNGKRVTEDAKGKWSTAIFFLVHYGFFHFGYAIFIGAASFGKMDTADGEKWAPLQSDTVGVLVAILGFFISHAFSFRQNVKADLAGRPNLGTMMFLPYARVVPMHLTIIFGLGMGNNRWALFLFLLLKTGADVLMHKVEHRVMQKNLKGKK